MLFLCLKIVAALATLSFLMFLIHTSKTDKILPLRSGPGTGKDSISVETSVPVPSVETERTQSQGPKDRLMPTLSSGAIIPVEGKRKPISSTTGIDFHFVHVTF